MDEPSSGPLRWVRKWSFELWFIDAAHSPWKSAYYQTHLSTVDGLRRWRQRALVNPDVVRYKVTTVRVMEGSKRTHCPSGHAYYTRWSTLFGRHEWTVCSCGGHHRLHCDEPGCPTEWTNDPPLADGCSAD